MRGQRRRRRHLVTTKRNQRRQPQAARLPFFQAMPLSAQAIANALGSGSRMAEYVETPLALSLAKRAQELGEAPDKSSSLYKSAMTSSSPRRVVVARPASSLAPRSRASTCVHYCSGSLRVRTPLGRSE